MTKNTIYTLDIVEERTRPFGPPILTGLQAFDMAMDGGIRGGELITLSGMSGHGKTSYALWQTKIIAESGVPTCWFTYEMAPYYLAQKLRKIGADPSHNICVPLEHNGNSDVWLKEKILEAQEKYVAKVFFIDHLHYLIPLNSRDNPSLLIGNTVRMLKKLAIETDTIIYLIAHMKRLGVGERANVDAIRDSALIANESDYAFIVERLKTKQNKGKMNDSVSDPFESDFSNYAKVQLAKNRRTGNLTNLFFEVKDQDFIELSRSEIKDLASTIQL